MQIEAVKKAPGDHYAAPDDLLADLRWSRDQQCEILKCWKQNLLQLSVAENENMQATDLGNKQAEMLAKVTSALDDILPSDMDKIVNASPNKAG